MHQTSQTQEINKQIKRSVSLLKVIEVSGNFNRSHTYTNTHTHTQWISSTSNADIFL